jgi:predicted transcriptional regulator
MADEHRATLTVQVARTLLADLDHIAKAADLSRSDVARRALTLHLDAVARSLGVSTAEGICSHCPVHCKEHAQ